MEDSARGEATDRKEGRRRELDVRCAVPRQIHPLFVRQQTVLSLKRDENVFGRMACWRRLRCERPTADPHVFEVRSGGLAQRAKKRPKSKPHSAAREGVVGGAVEPEDGGTPTGAVGVMSVCIPRW